jgi:ribosomal protein L12E/L44/L45/RPP1/RPP2
MEELRAALDLQIIAGIAEERAAAQNKEMMNAGVNHSDEDNEDEEDDEEDDDEEHDEDEFEMLPAAALRRGDALMRKRMRSW